MGLGVALNCVRDLNSLPWTTKEMLVAQYRQVSSKRHCIGSADYHRVIIDVTCPGMGYWAPWKIISTMCRLWLCAGHQKHVKVSPTAFMAGTGEPCGVHYLLISGIGTREEVERLMHDPMELVPPYRPRWTVWEAEMLDLRK